jgi:hypothetical protein
MIRTAKHMSNVKQVVNADEVHEVTSTGAEVLRDDQLEEVTGGLVVISIIAILIGQLIPR